MKRAACPFISAASEAIQVFMRCADGTASLAIDVEIEDPRRDRPTSLDVVMSMLSHWACASTTFDADLVLVHAHGRRESCSFQM